MLFGEKCKNYAVILFAEFLGTFLLMFFGCMGSIVLYSPFGAISFALTILASIQVGFYLKITFLSFCIYIVRFLNVFVVYTGNKFHFLKPLY